jgi:hypothetical protein
MKSMLVTILVTSAVVALMAYVLRRFVFSGRRSPNLDGGTVSQSWLTDHRAEKKDDRFS